jgi:hypothetical protein
VLEQRGPRGQRPTRLGATRTRSGACGRDLHPGRSLLPLREGARITTPTVASSL